MFIYLIYVDLPFHGCFTTFLKYVLDVFIAQMGIWFKQIPLTEVK